MTIQKKLFLSFACMIALLFAIALVTYNHMKQTQTNEQEMSNDAHFHYSLEAVQYRLAGMSNDERGYLLSGDEQYSTELLDKNKMVRDLFVLLKSKPGLDPSYLEFLVQMEQNFDTYFKASQQLLSKRKEGNVKDAQTIHFNEERQARKQLDTIVSQLIEKIDKEASQESINRQEENDRQNLLMLIIFVVAIVIALTIGWLLARSITKPLRVINLQLKEIAEGNGDLSREIMLRSKDEIAEVAHSYNQMVRNLRLILSQAKDTAIQVAASSEQLTASAEQTTRATENIVNVTQRISANSEREQQHMMEAVHSIQQISEGIQQVSEGNEEVSRLSHSALDASSKGANAVHDVLREMNEIHEAVQQAASVIQSLGDRSQHINGITNIITDLANRTNLLSLNAAIEAAQAGEHGKGFAVVAQEIRKLAEQSGQSARQINELIQEIVLETGQAVTTMKTGTDKVTLGLTKTAEVDKVFRTIEANVAAVTSQVGVTSSTVLELAASSRQIVAMMDGVSVASHEVAIACQSNSASTEEQLATMEEISSSSHELSSLAEGLHGTLSRFKLQ
jgi:methyl-accepting chemotaxis protein